MSVLGRPTWAIFDINLHQRVTALAIMYIIGRSVVDTTFVLDIYGVVKMNNKY